jgi:hypothetical protein
LRGGSYAPSQYGAARYYGGVRHYGGRYYGRRYYGGGAWPVLGAFGAIAGLGLASAYGYPYGYGYGYGYPYAYGASPVYAGPCVLRRQRVWTPWGWRREWRRICY